LGHGVKILTGAGDPNDVSNDDQLGTLASAKLASLFLKTDTGGLWIKNTQSTWLQII
jgi:hypothetical protein